MNPLVDDCPSAVERQRAAPARICIIFRRSVPLHARIHQQRFAQHTAIDPILQFADVRLHPVLKNHSELHAGSLRRFDEFVGAARADINRLFRQNMHTLLGRRDALRSVEARRAPEDHEIHGSVREKSGEVRVRRAAVFAAQPLHFFQVAAIHRSNLNTRNRSRGSRVCFGDISSTNQSNIRCHLRMRNVEAIP